MHGAHSTPQIDGLRTHPVGQVGSFHARAAPVAAGAERFRRGARSSVVSHPGFALEALFPLVSRSDDRVQVVQLGLPTELGTDPIGTGD